MNQASTRTRPAAAVDTAGSSNGGTGGVNPLMHLVESASALEHEGRGPLAGPSTATDFVSFYGLRENPFADSINAEYFYKTESHGEAIERMMLAAHYNTSLGMVTGPSGCGKTLVSQVLLQSLDPGKYETVLVLVTPGLTKGGLLREVLSELNVALPLGINRTQDLVKLLSNQVIDLYDEGRRLVIIIDEAHFLAADSLHILRTISNIEIPECKLVTCLLFGEPRLAKRLTHPSYTSLRNRIYMSSELQPMRVEDCDQYVKYRLMVAGRIEALFEDEAVAAVHEHSGGICRSVSRLCMLSLMESARTRKPRVDRASVDSCATPG
jgi:general secretion pathway protein A